MCSLLNNLCRPRGSEPKPASAPVTASVAPSSLMMASHEEIKMRKVKATISHEVYKWLQGYPPDALFTARDIANKIGDGKFNAISATLSGWRASGAISFQHKDDRTHFYKVADLSKIVTLAEATVQNFGRRQNVKAPVIAQKAVAVPPIKKQEGDLISRLLGLVVEIENALSGKDFAAMTVEEHAKEINRHSAAISAKSHS